MILWFGCCRCLVFGGAGCLVCVLDLRLGAAWVCCRYSVGIGVVGRLRFGLGWFVRIFVLGFGCFETFLVLLRLHLGCLWVWF